MNCGAIFDWDGVIVDSSASHEKSWELLALEEKLPLSPDYFKKGFGMKCEVIIPQILQWTTDHQEIARLSDRKEALYRELILKQGITMLPGVEQCLFNLKDLNVKCAIGSSTSRLNIQTALDILNIRDYFAGIISGEDVQEGKPHPEVFLRAASLLQCDPHGCIVFEDAPVGVAAARNAGMKVIGVASTHPHHVLHEADVVVQHLDELNVTRIREIFSHQNTQS